MPQQSFAALVLFVLSFLTLWVLAYFLLRRQERHALKLGKTSEDDLASSLYWEQGKREQKAVKNAIGVMSGTLDEHHLLREVCDAVSRGFRFSHVWIEMTTTPNQFHVPACHPHAFARDGASVAPQLSKRFIEANLTKTYKHLEECDDVELMPLQSRGLAFVAGIPLGHTGKAWGVLYLGDAAHRDIYHATIESVQVVSDHLSLVVERLRNDRTIERQGQLVRTLFKSTPDALVVVNEAGKIIQTNASFDALFGVDQGETLGRELGRFLRRHDQPEVEENILDELLEHGSSVQSSRGLWVGVEADQYFPVRLSIGEYRPDAKTRHWVLWLGDISQQVDHEAALTEAKTSEVEVRASEGRLLAKMGHALRTPLESIIASSGLLSETTLDPEQRDLVASLCDGVESMVISLGDALDIMQSRTRQLTLRQDAFTLHTILEELVEKFEQRASKANIDIHLHLDPDVPSAFVGDVVRLRQVLYRMLEDSLCRTRKGHVYLKVSEENRTIEGHNLCFNFSNTGDAPDPLWAGPIDANAMLNETYSDASVGMLNSLHLINLMAGTTLASTTADGGKLSLRLLLPSGEPTSSDHLRIYDNLQATLWGHNDMQSMVLQDLLREYGIESDIFDNLNDALEHLRESSGTNNGQLLIVPFIEQQALLPDLLTYFVEDTLLSGVNLVLVTQRSDRSTVTELISHGRIFSLPYPYKRRALGQILTSCSGQIEVGELGHGVMGRYAAPLEKKARLLYVEDNVINRQVCQRLLERWGFDCIAVNSGRAALNHLRQEQRTDLVLLDCLMPELDGFTTAMAIRTQERGSNRIPIIGMSQSDAAAYQQRCKEAGMDALLLKPLTPASLYRALHKFLNQKP